MEAKRIVFFSTCLIGAHLQANHGLAFGVHIIASDIGDVSHGTHAHTLLGRELIGAGLQANHGLSFLRHVVAPNVRDVPHSADAHAFLRGELIATGLETDDTVTSAKLLIGEVAAGLIGWSWADDRAIEAMPLALEKKFCNLGLLSKCA